MHIYLRTGRKYLEMNCSTIEQLLSLLNTTIRRCSLNAHVKRRSNDGASRLARLFIPARSFSPHSIAIIRFHRRTFHFMAFDGIDAKRFVDRRRRRRNGTERRKENKKKRQQEIGNSTPTLTSLVVADRPDRAINFWSRGRHWKLRGFHRSQDALALDLPR